MHAAATGVTSRPIGRPRISDYRIVANIERWILEYWCMRPAPVDLPKRTRLKAECGKPGRRRIAQSAYVPALVSLDLSGKTVIVNYSAQAPPVIVLKFAMLAAGSIVDQSAPDIV